MKNKLRQKMNPLMPLQFHIERVRDYLRGNFNIGPEIGPRYKKIVTEHLKRRLGILNA